MSEIKNPILGKIKILKTAETEEFTFWENEQLIKLIRKCPYYKNSEILPESNID